MDNCVLDPVPCGCTVCRTHNKIVQACLLLPHHADIKKNEGECKCKHL